MTAKFDVSTLNWVKGEIDASLDQARLALEAFVATPDDETQMGFCVMHLHQVHGTLQMVELYGAARAADEMERLAVALQEKRIADIERACEVLMRAILQLPDYLEGLQTGLSDNALVLLPLINEMRRLRGEQALPESDFFQPDLSVMPPAAPAPTVDIRVLAQKARPYYQSSLLHLLRGEETPQSLKTLRVLSDKLLAAATVPALRQWFWVFGGFIESLSGDGQVVRTAAKRLLSNGEQVIRQIGEGGEAAVKPESLSSLLTSLLFQVAQAAGSAGRVGELKTAFGLNRLMAGEAAPAGVGGFNAELKKTLAGDVLEELASVQDALDIFVRSERRAASSLLPLADTLSRIASTLVMMGQPALQEALERQVAVIRDLQDVESVADDNLLMGIASAVLAVDSALRDWGTVRPLEQADDLAGQVGAGELSPEAEAEHQRVIRQVMKEARSNLLRVKDAVDAYVAAPGDATPLAPLAGLLHEIIGSLTLLSYTRAARVLRACSLYIGNDLAKADTLPGSDMLDALADALTSIEYYMDAFVESRVHPGMVLEVAERACAKLGYPVDALPELVPAAVEKEALDEAEGAAGEVAITAPAAEVEESAVAAPEEMVTAAAPEEAIVAAAVPVTPAAPAQAPAASAGLDPEIVEIFIEEATEEITKINELLPRWQSNRGDSETLRDLRRSFHTLKGSGRLVGALRIGEFAWAFENMLNRVIDNTVEPSNAMFDLLDQAAEALPELVAEFREGTAVRADVEWLQEAANAMSTPGGLEAMLPPAPPPPAAVTMENAAPVEPAVPELDPVLLEIYGNETDAHLAIIEQFIAECRAEHGCRVTEALTRALHTLQGSSRMAGVIAVADVALPLEKYAKALHTAHVAVSPQGLNALERCVALTRDMLSFLQGTRAAVPGHQTLRDEAEALQHAAQRLAEGLEEIPEAGLAQAPEEVTAAATPQVEEEITGEAVPEFEAPEEEITLEGAAPEVPAEEDASFEVEAMPEPAATEEEEITLVAPEEEDITLEALEPVEEEAPPLEDILSSIAVEEAPAAPPSPPVVAAPAMVPEYDQELLDIFLEEGAEIIDASEESLQAWREHPDDRSLVEALQRQLHTLKGGARMAGVTPIGDLSHTLESIFEDIVEGRLTRSSAMFDLLQLAHDRLVTMLEQVRNNAPVVSADDLIARIRNLSGAAPQVPAVEEEAAAAPLSGFLEQAAAILEAYEVQLRAWDVEQDKQPLLLEIGRQLRDMKAAARDAGIASMADVAYSAELMVAATADGHVPLSPRMLALMQRCHDRLATMLDQLRGGHAPIPDAVLVEAMDELVAESRAKEVIPAPAPQPVARPEAAAEEGAEQLADRRRGQRLQQDVVRVRADLLDNLVNYAGEVSIYRSRVEQQVGSINYSLRDFGEILERMHDQLRQFAIETEAQMQSRYEDVDSTEYEDFDPLEFDRFTHMQQLSRSAMESLNDLVEVQQGLQSLTRETETLLLQQSRVSTELQEGLMHTRMMPLVEHAPRLRRIVRQTSAELGKEVELSFRGAEVEMDRHMVERMLAPIEHLLRNAIAHGIETPEQRRKAGKPSRGQIILAQVREGSEIVMRIIDDGAGINLERVRQKAIERGLMKPDAGLSDKEVVHFILESGFSTAETLTQVAGRGVGMDVVNSEIKQLGGLLEIDTRQGEGTTFTIRLPLTLSVSRALLVQAGEETYAVPMTSIQGIERLDRAQLEQLLAAENPTYTWLGREYELLPLSATLGLPPATTAPAEGEVSKRPLLFAHSGDHYVAWAADNLIGSREIVVKSLGPQLSKLRGLSGATILGDGSVALILDLPLLARLGLAQRSTAVVEAAPVSAQPLVMVVDDSITVRKVTSRLLERNDIRPVTAKDGVDAIAQLEEVMPDVMLLDIEMPRMDGYELATHIRNTDRLKHLPIIMITSRSGEKHRQRAMEIGVDFYMSKPYQEAELLENIHKLIAQRRGK
ncbi:Hpt domain-containing protein [Sulfurivermis fontis]|uniref:hybrid sensor histidine kinase/response regulator n=1 Tax=Sulfurivermis fontis TaxID=1972068 RepID=UPI0015597379|nr:Hpt domain-containing protein [Sulfurivermis fontis]